MAMTQPLVKNRVQRLNLPVIDFFIFWRPPIYFLHLPTFSLIKKKKKDRRQFANTEGCDNPLSIYLGYNLNDIVNEFLLIIPIDILRVLQKDDFLPAMYVQRGLCIFMT